MVGIDRTTGQPIGRAEHIAQAIETLLTTPRGTMVMARDVGVDYLDATGRPIREIGPAGVERSAHAALTDHEPRISIATITAHFEGDALEHVRIQWHDADDGSEHEITVSYKT